MEKRLIRKGASWFLRLASLSLLILVAFSSFALFEEIYKKRQVDGEIKKLEDEARRIEKENSQIKDKIAYLESRDFQEKEARDKLNLQGEGESLLVVKPSLAKENSQGNGSRSNNFDQAPASVRSNYEKWWDYFFKY
jgi:cell division protein FtsB